MAATPGAAQHTLHPGQQLGGLEGLDNVVVGTHPQPPDPVGHLPLGGQKDHRRAAVHQLGHQGKAVNAGQHHIQQHQVIEMLVHQAGGRDAVGGGLDPAAQRFEDQADQLPDGLFVLDNQDGVHGSLLLV